MFKTALLIFNEKEMLDKLKCLKKYKLMKHQVTAEMS